MVNCFVFSLFNLLFVAIFDLMHDVVDLFQLP